MKKTTIKTIVIIAGYLVIAAIGLFWGSSYKEHELRVHLQRISPLMLEVNFGLLLAAILVNLRLFQTIIRKISRSTKIKVILIALGGMLLAMFAAPRTHRIYYDEDIYLNIGQNIAELKRAAMCNEGRNFYGEYSCQQLEYNKEPNGWPYLLSLLFRLTPPAHMTAFLLNNLIWGLSSLAVFLLGWLLFRNEMAGLLGAVSFIFLPEGLRWANTTATEPAAALLTALGILSVLVFVRYPKGSALLLAAVMLPFAFQFRPESAMLMAPVGLLLLLLAPAELKQPRLYAAGLLLCALIVPHLIHLYAVRGEGWGVPAGMSKLALEHIKTNFRPNTLFYVKNLRFPVLMTFFFLAGLGMPLFRSRFFRGEVTKFPSWEGQGMGKKGSGQHAASEPTPNPSQEGNSCSRSGSNDEKPTPESTPDPSQEGNSCSCSPEEDLTGSGKPVRSSERGVWTFCLKEKLVLLVWFLFFWGIFLYFYAGSYNFGVDVRFSLLSHLPLMILAGYGISAFSGWCRAVFRITWMPSVLFLFVLFSGVSFLSYVRTVGSEAWASRADHHFAETLLTHLPPHSLILTHNPNMFLVWGDSAAQASHATYKPQHLRQLFQQYSGGIYFHYNFWCAIPDAVQNAFCETILKRFNTTEIASFQEQTMTFRLYKLDLKEVSP